MEFLYPAFLAALAAIAIPVIIHLFNFRRFKKIYFPNVKFIEEIQQRTRSHSQLKHLLVLACRILAIAALVFAFARPFIPSETSSTPVGDKAVSFYLNNAFSMEAEGENGVLLNVAKERIRSMVDAYNETDRFQLLTNEFEGRQQRLVDKTEFLDLLEEVEAGPYQRELSEVMTRQKDALINSEAVQRKSYLVSDLLIDLVDEKNWEPDSLISTVIVPIEANSLANLFIDSLWFDEPVRQLNRSDKVNVRIVNTSEDAVLDRSLYLHINGKQRGLASFSVDPQSFIDTLLAFTNTTAGIHKAVVSLRDHPISYDDEMHFSYDVAGSIDILEIHDLETESDVIGPMFLEDDIYHLTSTNIASLDASLIPKHDLLIIHSLNHIPSGSAQELDKFIKNGGSILLFPGNDIDTPSYTEFLSSMRADKILSVDTTRTKVGELDLDAPLFKDLLLKIDPNMDLPKVDRHYRTTNSVRMDRTELMSLQNGDPFLLQFGGMGGNFYMATVPLDPAWSNLTRHAFFVAIVLRTAELSTPTGDLYYMIGGEEAMILNGVDLDGTSPVHIVDEGTMDIIPEIRNQGDRAELFVHDQIDMAGSFDVQVGNDAVGVVSFNYDRSSSNLTTVDLADLEATISTNGLKNISILDLQNKTITASLLKELDEGKHLWRWFIVLALIFLALETVLIRLWK